MGKQRYTWRNWNVVAVVLRELEVKAMIWIPLGRNFRERSRLTKGIFVKFLFGHI